MSDFISDGDIIWTNAAGTVRVRVAHDEDPHPPEFDGAMPTLRVESRRWSGADAQQVYGFHRYGFDAVDAWERFAATFSSHRTAEVFARYVAVFHGGTTVHTHNIGRSSEYGYVTFDTAAWWQEMGRTEVVELISTDTTALAVLRALDELIPGAPGSPGLGVATGLDEQTVTAALARLAAAGLAKHTTTYYNAAGWVRTDGAGESFAEYRAYLDGETYGLILEHKVALHITREDLAFPARPWEDTDTEEWTEVDAVWGIYGDDKDNALSSARGNLDLEDTGDAAA